MNREELKNYLPHREPMLLVDECILDEQHVAHSKYHVTGEEFFLKGHFPGKPVVPGVILCEIMAQSCALLMKEDLPGNLHFTPESTTCVSKTRLFQEIQSRLNACLRHIAQTFISVTQKLASEVSCVSVAACRSLSYQNKKINFLYR